ncbi:MAG TPA: archease [Longimicrobiales bacterium]|nr:archease [Longimicrobiales bacterium]
MSAERGTERDAAVELPAGVRPIDHVGDIGIEVSAGSLEELFTRAAAGMIALTRERPERGAAAGAAPMAREVEGAAGDVAELLVTWLRELLYLQEADGFSYAGAEFPELDEHRFRARVRGRRAPRRALREIKGVTYHGLDVARRGDAWHARVIFDV